MSKSSFPALPLFDTIEHIKSQLFPNTVDSKHKQDFLQAKSFLQSYDGNHATFNAYRREIERLLHWSWLVANKSIRELRRTDIEAYIQFCQSPPLEWIGTQKTTRFIDRNGERIPNPEWRPFVATVSKSAHRRGILPDPNKYHLSAKALREIFTVSSSFYHFLIQEDYTEVNPVQHVRQKSRYFLKMQGKQKIRRLSSLQWHYVIETAEQMAYENPDKHQKTLFIMTALYSMYLRISELAASHRWIPKMCDFYRDQDGLWWFTVIGKGNKQRQIAVSDQMLNALRTWRAFLNLAPLPSPVDDSPLLPKTIGKGPITSTSHLRKIIQSCFDYAIERLKKDGLTDDADALLEATVHWLRHTGISDDVKRRPREHVRDDAGHSSSAITDKYIDIELRERHASAKKKPVREDS
ncbi:MAG: site-specific integrase [Gammaproteobacteria bacterium]|nr:site-specific integrase [Gammaproteobacteria bacterium]